MPDRSSGSDRHRADHSASYVFNRQCVSPRLWGTAGRDEYRVGDFANLAHMSGSGNDTYVDLEGVSLEHCDLDV